MPWSFFTNTGSLKISAVPTSATVLSAQPVLETGISNQRRAGRVLTVADFTTLLALPTTPAGLFNLTTTANLGSGGTLVNRGTVTFGGGITGMTITVQASAQASGVPVVLTYGAGANAIKLASGRSLGIYAQVPADTAVGAGESVTLRYDGTTAAQRVAVINNGTTSYQQSAPLFLQVRLTPSAAARAYGIRGWRANTNGEWNSSSGTTSADSGQGFIRIERDI